MNKDLTVIDAVIIGGPTATGKTDLAIKKAIAMDGEVINADSRQVYKHMDIGTSKPAFDNTTSTEQIKHVLGVPHHLFDISSPDQTITLADYQEQALEAILDIHSRGKKVIIAGGTGLYIDCILKGYNIKKVEPNPELRKSIEKLEVEEQYTLLEKIDKDRAKELNESDKKNPRRLTRAIEIALERYRIEDSFEKACKPTKVDQFFEDHVINPEFYILLPEKNKIKENIIERTKKMQEMGLQEEVEALVAMGYSFDLPSMQGIGYKEFEQHLSNPEEVSTEEVYADIVKNTFRYAKRQITWFKRYV